MAIVVVHRLPDWPAFEGLRPLLEALGVHADSFEYWHWFSASPEASDALLGAAPERGARPHEAEALFAAGADLAAFAPAALEPGEKAALGFHDAASREQLEEVAAARGDVLVWVGARREGRLSVDAETIETMVRCADLDGVAAGGEEELVRLLGGVAFLSCGVRTAGLVVEAWCRRGLTRIGSRALVAAAPSCRDLLRREIADVLLERARRGELACRDLLVLAPWTNVFTEVERAQLIEAVPAAVARHPCTLDDLYTAHVAGWLDDEAVDAAITRSLEQATEGRAAPSSEILAQLRARRGR